MKIRNILVTLLISLLLVGCGTKNNAELIPQTDVKENAEFKLFLDSLMVDFVSPKDFTINLIAKDPDSLGFNIEPYELTFSNKDDVSIFIEDLKTDLASLVAFDENTLSSQQIIDKRVIEESIRDMIAMEPYYDYEYGSGVIGVSRSLLGSLPAYLESYTFRNQRDVDYYMHFLETLPSNIQKYIDFEIERQSRNTGFSHEELKDIERQYSEIAKSASLDDYFLINHFNDSIDSLSFIEDPSTLKNEHSKLIKDSFSKSYAMIAESFGQIEGSDASGLSSKPNGKEYYELLLKQSTGKNMSVQEIESFIDKKFNEAIYYISFLSEEKHNLLFDKLSKEEFGSFEDGRDLLDFISKVYDKDYPKIELPTYDLRKVDSSMEDSSSPAFYFTPPVDYVEGDTQIIYINGDFNNNLYTTYAHEGIPGHMYQFTYFSQIKEMHPIRNLISNGANAEGWANYTEKRSVEYVSDSEFREFYTAYQIITEIAHIKADIGIHYHGWNKDDLKEYFAGLFGELDGEAIDEIYLNFVTNPAVYPTYYLSSLYYEELQTKALKELDDKFDLVEFHKSILDAGSASFNVLEMKVNEYIKASK